MCHLHYNYTVKSPHMEVESPIEGRYINIENDSDLTTLRPAKPSEIPKQEPTGEQLVGLLCMYDNHIFEVESFIDDKSEIYPYFTAKDNYSQLSPLSIKALESYLERAKKAGVE